VSVKVKEVLGEDPEVFFAEKRYELIAEIVPRVLRGAKPLTLSDLLDRVFLNKYLGIPIFLAFWWALFRFTFDVSAPFSDIILARAAFVVDKIMYKLGLHGRSFIPMLIGFGCNIPGVMATRTIDSEKDRILTILVNPLMSCSARLPVYILI